jgi:hypothetical protein
LETSESAAETTSSLLTLSVAASLARISALPEVDAAWTVIEADCGQNTLESFAKLDLDSSLWRTHQHLLTGDLDEFSQTWPRSGMTRNGIAYPLPPLAPLTYETEFGYLPTPQASDSLHEFSPATNMLVLWNKETTGLRPSGAKIGSSLRWCREFVMEQQRTGGNLNPEWYEVLMGYPIGWTELEDSETP